MKRSVILTDRLGPDILSAFWTKGQVLNRECAHLKVPGFSIVLNVLLTRKLPTFLSRLNKISGISFSGNVICTRALCSRENQSKQHGGHRGGNFAASKFISSFSP